MFGQQNQQYGNYQPQQQYSGYQSQQQNAPTTNLDSLDDLLSGGGAKAFFNGDSKPGATITGTVDLIETTQMHDFQTKQPSFWNDGRPQMQIHIVIQTQLRDPSVDDDDGRRSLWIKGWGIQLKAFREACQQAGIKAPKKGDQITAAFTGYGDRGNAPQPPKVYAFQIQPANSVSTLINQSQPVQNQPLQANSYQQPKQPLQYQQPQMVQNQQSQPATYQQPPQQVAQQLPQLQVNPQQVLQLKALGKTPQEVAGLLGTTVETVLSITDAANPTMHSGSEEDLGF